MEGAPPPLRKETGRDALPPEQRALQKLLAADAIFPRGAGRVSEIRSSGGRGGNQRQQQELAGLFELELDKMKNQYETVQRRSNNRHNRKNLKLNGSWKNLRGARNRRSKNNVADAGQPAKGSSGGNQRQQQELIDETRNAARELERLSRERRDAQMQELSRQLNQTADEMQKAQASSRNNPNESICAERTRARSFARGTESLATDQWTVGRQRSGRIVRTPTAD